MWRGKLSGTALAANLRVAGIRVSVWAELEIVGAAAKVAKERLAGCYAVALVAIAHGFTRAIGVGHRLGAPRPVTKNHRS
jgi:hypothetical protein